MSPSPLPSGELFNTPDDVQRVEPMPALPGVRRWPLRVANDVMADPDQEKPRPDGIGADAPSMIGFGDEPLLDDEQARALHEPSNEAAEAWYEPVEALSEPTEAPYGAGETAHALSEPEALPPDPARRFPLGRVLRYGVGAVALGVLAAGIYQGSQYLAERAAATLRPVALPQSTLAQSTLPQSTLPQPTLPQPTLPQSTLPQPGSSQPAAPSPVDPAQYRARAAAGEPAAQYDVAVLTARGSDGLSQDLGGAAAWFEKAALGGNVEAQFDLGVIYERGLGVAPNMAEAVVWYRSAAEREYPPAQYNLAAAFAEGRGVPRDLVAAARWYRAAAMHHLAPAMVNFAILCERGDGVERSPSDAYAWYRAAARRGDAIADARAGELFRKLDGPVKAQAVMAASSVLLALGEAPPEGLPPTSTVSTEPVAATAPAGPAPVLRPGGWVGNFNADWGAGLGPPQSAPSPTGRRQSASSRQRQG